MKVLQFIKIFPILLIFSLAVNAQTAENSERLTFDKILSKLMFTSRISTSNEKINNELAETIKSRKINFKLDEEKEKKLKNARATDYLLETIRQNQPEIFSFEAIKQYFDKTPKDKTSLEEANKYLTLQACEVNVDFTLTNKQEESLLKIGVNKTLLYELSYSKKLIDLYNTFLLTYSSRQVDQLKIAINTAKEFVKFVETTVCPNQRDLGKYVEYFNSAIPDLEKLIEDLSKPPVIYDPPRNPERRKRYEKFDKAYRHSVDKNEDWKKVFEAGDEILKYDEPVFLDAAILMAAIGYNRVVKPDLSKDYDEKTISYAELAIKLIEKGINSKEYGVYNYRYKSKNNTLGWMNFIIGYIKYYRLNQKEEGAKYLLKASEYDSDVKNFKEISDALPSSR